VAKELLELLAMVPVEVVVNLLLAVTAQERLVVQAVQE
jgi:hypothetical protein